MAIFWMAAVLIGMVSSASLPNGHDVQARTDHLQIRRGDPSESSGAGHRRHHACHEEEVAVREHDDFHLNPSGPSEAGMGHR